MDVPSMERVDVIICSFYDRVIRGGLSSPEHLRIIDR